VYGVRLEQPMKQGDKYIYMEGEQLVHSNAHVHVRVLITLMFMSS
jgi:hypothetical protein